MKNHSLALAILLCVAPSVCYALAPTASSGQLVITEVMYDPAGVDYGHEWFEVYNVGDSNVPLSSYKVLEGDAKHNIIAAGSPAGGSLAPENYAVIAQNAADFQKEYPNFSGQLFHSAISLDNAGATIELVNASSSVVASAIYDSASGALGDGNSLQRASADDSFVARTPSPGASMSSSVIPGKTKAASSKQSSTHATPASKTNQTAISSPLSSTEQLSHDDAASTSQVVYANAADSGNSYMWWVGAAALAAASAAAFFFAYRYKSREWNIIEEN